MTIRGTLTLEEASAHIGERVVYAPRNGFAEWGTITSVNDTYVFVRYDDDQHSKATKPSDLTLDRRCVDCNVMEHLSEGLERD